jgi:ureidoacrylate peracid hydrolase
MRKPIFCFIDIQKEYTTEGRPFFIKDITPSLEKARLLLEVARKMTAPIVHIKHLQEGAIFTVGSHYSDYVEGFEPKEGEKEVIKHNFSCFSSPDFTKTLNLFSPNNELVIIGYGSSMCCLPTIIEGYHRGYQMIFPFDASNAKPTKEHSSLQVHEVMSDVLSTFSEKITTEAFIQRLSGS